MATEAIEVEIPTARQSEVLTYVLQGKSNREIGMALGITEKTVKAHVTALFRLYDVHNRTALVVKHHAQRTSVTDERLSV